MKKSEQYTMTIGKYIKTGFFGHWKQSKKVQQISTLLT